MKKKHQISFLLSLLLLSATGLAAQDGGQLIGQVVDDTAEPIVAANVYWLGTNIHTSSGEKGEFAIEHLGAHHRLVVSCAGFVADTIDISHDTKQRRIMLQSIVMDHVEVIGFRKGRSKLRLSIENREQISEGELIRAACCNLGESFTTNPSVDVSTTDAATGTKQIKLLGLSGKYVQMQTENIPGFRGISAPYSLGYIPGAWIQSIQVSKGAASVKNGFESMTGQINVEYKKPNVDRYFEGNAYLDQGLRAELNLAGNYQFGDRWSTALLAHVEDRSMAHDANHDTFVDMPMMRQYNVMNRWTYRSARNIIQSGFLYLYENRRAGQYGHHTEALATPYLIGIKTHRGEAFVKAAHILDPDRGSSIALIVDGSKQQLDAGYGHKVFEMGQDNLYTSLLFETQPNEQHALSTGLSWQYDHYDGQHRLEQTALGPLTTNRYNESVPGAYFQYTYTPVPQLAVLGGIRADHSNLHGTFVTPRFHIRYNPSSAVSLRLSAGKGYRTHGILVENNHLLASGREIVIHEGADKLQEASWNYGISVGLDIPVGGSKKVELNAEYYYTDFDKRVVIDMDSHPHELHFYGMAGSSYSHTFQIDASYTLLRGLDLMVAFRLSDVRNTIGGRLRSEPLTSRYKALLTASYKTPLRLWQGDVTFSLNGSGRMPDPYTLTNGASSWDSSYGTYPLVSAQITRFFPKWSAYVGGENLTNYRQPNPIVNAQDPWSKAFDSTMVWGPTDGIMVYAGIRFNLFD